uniref:TATA box-binding protein-associated factor RNA polymerase I subunit B n=1 Tax=Stomoxys calcitrans TaxID=35570 RepID=A0A1I8NWU3_STOCA|nr:unnamed protein product [Stomoxys calcitrans]
MEDEIIPNITCGVCGETDFEQREGFYYCLECGTKQEQVRQVEVENEDDAFNETTGTKRSKTMKINVAKAEKPQITSWECYNYILRGYVEELLAFGAKEELKLMALQVWAAYLRRNEVAFFSKKHAELPRLGARYTQNDAETIFNHTKKKRQRRKSTNTNTSGTSGGEEMSARSWRKTKRQLNESLYSSMTSATSTTVNSNKAIKLTFNMKARKILKKRMPAKHLLRHEMDFEGELQCHKMPTVRELSFGDYSFMNMGLKQVYTVLAIALNLIGDNMQLTDMVRFINEGHIGWKNILQYFPENIAGNATEILQKIGFYIQPEKILEKGFRTHVGVFAKHIGIRRFTTPNMMALVKRYVTELCLPPEISIYAERLINLLPPRFEIRTALFYPAYEARAMAYIIFIMKLLFGLDGYKEHRISKTAKKLNLKILELNHRNNENRPLLFVWDDWQRYIEMRKIIVSHYNLAFCKQFHQSESIEQILQGMADETEQRKEHEQANMAKQQIRQQNFDNLRKFFEKFLENHEKANINGTKFDFKPTYTPASTYFKTILLHRNHNNSGQNVSIPKIPQFMHTDHSQRDMQSYLEVKPLIEYFRNNNKELKVCSLETTENRHYVGIFRNTNPVKLKNTQKADFNITDKEWTDKISNQKSHYKDELEWTKDLEGLEEASIPSDSVTIMRSKKQNNSKLPSTQHEVSNSSKNTTSENQQSSSIKSLPDISIEVFRETNMDPLPEAYDIEKPRRNLGIVDMFAGIEDEEYLYSKEDSIVNDAEKAQNHSSR